VPFTAQTGVSGLITTPSGYIQKITGLSLSNNGISIPFGFGTNWTQLAIGITARTTFDNISTSTPINTGYLVGPIGSQYAYVPPSTMLWIGVKTNNGNFPTGGAMPDGDFLGYSSYAASGTITGTFPATGFSPPYSQIKYGNLATGTVVLGDTLIANFYGQTNSLGFAQPPMTGINLPLFNPSPVISNLPLSSGDYTNFVLMLTKIYQSAGGSNYLWTMSGEFIFDARSVATTGGIGFLTKYPSLAGLENVMDNFYSFTYSGYGYPVIGASAAPTYNQNSAFIYTPLTGWQISDILIKRYA
jgi:hypothetical protein